MVVLLVRGKVSLKAARKEVVRVEMTVSKSVGQKVVPMAPVEVVLWV